MLGELGSMPLTRASGRFPRPGGRGVRRASGWARAFCLGLPLVLGSSPVLADVPQSGVVPIPLAASDVSYLMGDRAQRSDTIYYYQPDSTPSKRGWCYNQYLASQFYSWSVHAPAAADYEVIFVGYGVAGATVLVSSSLGTVSVTPPAEWARTPCAQALPLPAGDSVITARLAADLPAGQVSLRTFEIMPAAAAVAFHQRAAAFRTNDDWFQRSRYGLGIMWGEWTYPPSGPKKPYQQKVDDFQVEPFADAVADMGADYVLFSTSWWTYFIPAPIAAIDAIVPGHTSTRDLLGEIADALDARGIRLILYYHTGHGTPDWWNLNWVTNDDKTLFVTNWKAVVTEMGLRYGRKLSGWFFDDGLVYYPAPFEEMATAARAGNPDRLVCWNSWVLPEDTEFQDWAPGEQFSGWRFPDGTLVPIDGIGRYLGGTSKDLRSQSYFTYDSSAWGIASPNQGIPPPTWNEGTTAATIRQYAPRKLTFGIAMYEDGAFSPLTRSTLSAVRQSFEPPSVVCSTSKWVLTPTAPGLVDVGLGVTVTDARDGHAPIPCTIGVYAGDVPADSPAAEFAPSTGLRLSGSAAPPSLGRSYLIGFRSSDSDGNPALAACSVLVPATPTPSHLTRLLWDAVEAEAAFAWNSAAPLTHPIVVLPEESIR